VSTEPQASVCEISDKGAEPDSVSSSLHDAFPARIRHKYYLKAAERSAEVRVFTDEKGEYLAFKDTGDRLSTRLDSPGVVRDMVAVTEHRGWQSLQVRGSDEFRRVVWLEASIRGIEVAGYEPTDIDRQTLEKRRNARDEGPTRGDRGSEKPERAPMRSRDSATTPKRLDAGTVVDGRLVEVGTAPYRHRKGARQSTYIVLELSDGRRHEAWGANLGRAVEDSGAKTGDWIQVRRGSVEVRTKNVADISRDGSTGMRRDSAQRNRWAATAERFRTLDRKEAVNDPALAAAHSHLAVLERTLERTLPGDQQARDMVLQVARERIAVHLEKGHSFLRAEYGLAERSSGTDDRARGPREVVSRAVV
jgi:hypothetical protein